MATSDQKLAKRLVECHLDDGLLKVEWSTTFGPTSRYIQSEAYDLKSVQPVGCIAQRAGKRRFNGGYKVRLTESLQHAALDRNRLSTSVPRPVALLLVV